MGDRGLANTHKIVRYDKASMDDEPAKHAFPEPSTLNLRRTPNIILIIHNSHYYWVGGRPNMNPTYEKLGSEQTSVVVFLWLNPVR